MNSLFSLSIFYFLGDTGGKCEGYLQLVRDSLLWAPPIPALSYTSLQSPIPNSQHVLLQLSEWGESSKCNVLCCKQVQSFWG